VAKVCFWHSSDNRGEARTVPGAGIRDPDPAAFDEDPGYPRTAPFLQRQAAMIQVKGKKFLGGTGLRS